MTDELKQQPTSKIESVPVPEIAVEALAAAGREHVREIEQEVAKHVAHMADLERKTLAVMQLKPEDGWRLDPATKCAVRDIAERGPQIVEDTSTSDPK